MEKQFELIGGKDIYLSVCKKYQVSAEFLPELDGYLLQMPFELKDSLESREVMLSVNRELADYVQCNQNASGRSPGTQ